MQQKMAFVRVGEALVAWAMPMREARAARWGHRRLGVGAWWHRFGTAWHEPRRCGTLCGFFGVIAAVWLLLAGVAIRSITAAREVLQSVARQAKTPYLRRL